MKTERVYASLFLLMFFGKMLHLPVSGVIIVLTGYAMALSYFLGGFYFFCDEEIRRQNLALSIIGGICLSVAPMGIMYRLDYWPDSDFMLTVSIILSFCVLVFTWALKRSAKEELAVYYKNMLSRSLTLFVVTTLLYVIPISTIVHMQYWDNKEFADIAGRLAANPYNETYKKEYDQYVSTHTPSGKLIKIKAPAAPVDKTQQPQKKHK